MRKTKRVLSLIMTIVMIASMVPAMAFAVDESQEAPAVESNGTAANDLDDLGYAPVVPAVVYIGAQDNSLAKQEYGDYIQTALLNYKTLQMEPADLSVSIVLPSTVNDLSLTVTSGINLSAVTTATEGDNTRYTWTITGGTSSAESVIEYTFNYTQDGVAMRQYACSVIESIASPAGHFVYNTSYRNSNESKYKVSQTYVMTVTGPHVYGSARVTADTAREDIDKFTDAAPGYYNFNSEGDGGFVRKDMQYGMHVLSPKLAKLKCCYDRMTDPEVAPVATIYNDSSVVSTITEAGLTINYWRHLAPENNVDSNLRHYFRKGDIGYHAWTENADISDQELVELEKDNLYATADTISVTDEVVNLPNPKHSMVSIGITGGAIPGNGTEFTLVSYSAAFYTIDKYKMSNHTYTPVLLRFATYNKADLRQILNAERLAARQASDDDELGKAYNDAFKNAYRQLNEVTTNQTNINLATKRLKEALTNLLEGGEAPELEIPDQKLLVTKEVPSKIYIAADDYGARTQTPGNLTKEGIVNTLTGELETAAQFKYIPPNGAKQIECTVTKADGTTIGYSYSPTNGIGKVLADTAANVGDIIIYKFSFTLNGKRYYDTAASVVENAPNASGMVVEPYASSGNIKRYIQMAYWFGITKPTVDGFVFEQQQANFGSMYTLNFTATGGGDRILYYNNDLEKRIPNLVENVTSNGGVGGLSWWGGKCGNDKDEGYVSVGSSDWSSGAQDSNKRARFTMYFDSATGPKNYEDTGVIFRGMSMANKEYREGENKNGDHNGPITHKGSYFVDGATKIVGAPETVSSTMSLTPFKTVLYETHALGNAATAELSNSQVAGATQIAANTEFNFQYVHSTYFANLSGTPTEGTYTFADYVRSGVKKDTKTKYLNLYVHWEINVKMVDKSALRDAIAKYDKKFMQPFNGFEDDGAWQEYLSALATAKGYLHNLKSTPKEDADAVKAIENAVAALNYATADYSQVEDLVNEIIKVEEDGSHSFRPYVRNDYSYYQKGEFYAAEHYINPKPIDDIYDQIQTAYDSATGNKRLDVRYQSRLDGYAEALTAAWVDLTLKRANYDEVNECLNNARGIDKDHKGGAYILLPPYYDNRTYVSSSGETLPIDQPDIDLEDRYVDVSNYDNDDSFDLWFFTCQKAVFGDQYKSPDQAKVDEYAQSLKQGYAGLRLKKGDYTGIDRSINGLKDHLETQSVMEVVCPSDPSRSYTKKRMNTDYSEACYAVISADYESKKYWTIIEQDKIDAYYDDYVTPKVADALSKDYLVELDLTFVDEERSIGLPDSAQGYFKEPEKYFTIQTWLNYKTYLYDEYELARFEVKDAAYQEDANHYVNALYKARMALKFNPANYTQVDELLDEINRVYTPRKDNFTNWEVLQNEIDAIDRNWDIRDQEKVDAYIPVLREAISKLVLKRADYSLLQAAYDSAYERLDDQKFFTGTTVEEFNAALNRAKAFLDADKVDIENQSAVQAEIDALNAAVAAIKYRAATITPIKEVLSTYGYVDSYYRDDFVAEYGDADGDGIADVYKAYDDALTVAKRYSSDYDAGKLDARNDADIEAAAKKLEEEFNALPALFSYIDEVIATVPEDLAPYTDEAVQALTELIASLDRNAKFADQGDIEDLADTIAIAISELEYNIKPADPSKVNAAIAAADKKIAGIDVNWWIVDKYNDFVAAYNEAKAALEDDYDYYAQADLDAFATALESATAALAYKPADYTNYNAAIKRYNSLDSSNIESESYAALQTTYNSIVTTIGTGWTIDKQTQIDEAAKKLNEAIDGVKYLNAVYTELDAAIANATPYLAQTDLYTAASLANLKAAIDAGNEISRELDGSHQAEINQLRDNINNAVTALDKIPASYTALDEALAAAKKINMDYLTDSAKAEFNQALQAAMNIDRNLKIDNQSAVDAITNELVKVTNAAPSNYKDADCSAIDNAMASIPADLKIYTDASVENLKKAIAAAEALRGSKADKQTEIDAAAAAITKAIGELELKPTQIVPVAPTQPGKTETVIQPTTTDDSTGVTKGYIYGIDHAGNKAVTDLEKDGYVSLDGQGRIEYEYVGNNTVLGTGAKVKIYDGKNVLKAEYTVLVFGDINGDGAITSTDADDVLFWAVNLESEVDYSDKTDARTLAMDLDGDGEVTLNDVNLILFYQSGLLSDINQNPKGA